MRAVWNALIEFQEEIQGENLLIRCDNATVVAYCKTLEAESWHEWQRDLCLGFPLFEKYVELLMV
jgi:hypothetical protein